MVELFDIIPFKSIEDLPASPFPPHFIAGHEGLYLHKDTLIGNCLIPQKDMPEHLPRLGEFKNGYFHFRGPKVPKEIIAQAFDFFKKVFKERKTEAEVFILMNEDTKEFKIFVPWQVVSSGSVNSIYEDPDIPEGFSLIGTMHSHCDFAAFHSGTDEKDAADFNGLHITIGHVDSANPSFDAMIMINGLKFNYDVDTVAETDDLLADICSDEWFKFIYEDIDKLLDEVKFKTLSKQEIDKFEWECRPYVSWIGEGKKDKKNKNAAKWIPGTNYDDNWDNDDIVARFYGSGNYLTNTRWHSEFKRSLPSDWFESPAYGAKLKPEYFSKVLEEYLDDLSALAIKHGIILDYGLYGGDDLGLIASNWVSEKSSMENIVGAD